MTPTLGWALKTHLRDVSELDPLEPNKEREHRKDPKGLRFMTRMALKHPLNNNS